ncbi:DUF2158 domain-containing protein [Bradyrhizobium tropiciagri]|uniref:DUF2158 domain-containing protein n=1 Tax=Bradyrhizobium tropiciagri TaxID=312253 RepID=UPI001BA80359|nr:DUF2158 domain-containing protein [Bradyrhizobium tropiciagri]MBR0870572.1 DUF2158 domain-containing protein [Bradyrhizobium tropiciagri]
MELKPGDVVILKSGGHPLTVVEVNEENVECLWMGVDGDLFRETLPVIALESTELDPEEDEEEDDEEEDDEDEDEDEEEDDEDEDDDGDRKKKRKAA